MYNVDEEDVECDPVGEPVYVDATAKRMFYYGVIVKDNSIKLGDCVKIKIADEADELEKNLDDNVDNCSVGQILAIYDDQKLGMMVEVRWFHETHEVSEILGKSKRKRLETDFLDDEIIESELLDDVPAVSLKQLNL